MFNLFFWLSSSCLSHALEHIVDTALEETGAEALYQDIDLQAQKNGSWLNPKHLQQLQQQVLALLNTPELISNCPCTVFK
jgi:ribosomal protein L16 Arg81 hydroxylase